MEMFVFEVHMRLLPEAGGSRPGDVICCGLYTDNRISAVLSGF